MTPADSNAIIGFVLVWASCGVLASLIWQHKGGKPMSGFLIGALLGVFGLGYVAITTPSKAVSILNPMQGAAPDGYGECPHCKERMRHDVSVCPHCRRDVPPPGPPPAPSDTAYTWVPPQ